MSQLSLYSPAVEVTQGVDAWQNCVACGSLKTKDSLIGLFQIDEVWLPTR